MCPAATIAIAVQTVSMNVSIPIIIWTNWGITMCVMMEIAQVPAVKDSARMRMTMRGWTVGGMPRVVEEEGEE